MSVRAAWRNGVGWGLVAGLLWVSPAWAQDEPDEDADGAVEETTAAPAGDSPPASAAAEAEAPQPLEAIVRGFYVEGRLGGGYMLVNQQLTPDAFNPGATGEEAYGVGGLVLLAAGYDIIDLIAVQAFGGTLLADGRRRDQVRDMSMFFGGAGARLAIDITERLDYTAQVGAMFVSADNAVEAAQQGFGVLVATGLEYYVHVRHFSVGIDVTMILPVMPVRLFLAVTPVFKYTF